MRVIEKEIHVRRPHLALLCLRQTRIAPSLNALEMIGIVGVAHHSIGAQLVGALCDNRSAIKSDSVFFLFEKRRVASNRRWFLCIYFLPGPGGLLPGLGGTGFASALL